MAPEAPVQQVEAAIRAHCQHAIRRQGNGTQGAVGQNWLIQVSGDAGRAVGARAQFPEPVIAPRRARGLVAEREQRVDCGIWLAVRHINAAQGLACRVCYKEPVTASDINNTAVGGSQGEYPG